MGVTFTLVPVSMSVGFTLRLQAAPGPLLLSSWVYYPSHWVCTAFPPLTTSLSLPQGQVGVSGAAGTTGARGRSVSQHLPTPLGWLQTLAMGHL